jgi:erythromycin esterase-like protein
MRDDELVAIIERSAYAFSGARADFDPLLDLAKSSRLVLIGESTHGTHEFYRERAELTKRLILELGFSAVAVEADWPDAYRVNRYVRALGNDANAAQALGDFRRFPAWMWRNADVLDFVRWLRELNDARRPEHKVGFYGLDLYSLHGSIEAVLAYLDGADPAAAARARARYECFGQLSKTPERYTYNTGLGLTPSCEREVIAALLELQSRRASLLETDGIAAEDEHFCAEQNARLVKSAEEYYRSMFQGHVASWNLRDTHMTDTLDALMAHLGRRRSSPKIVVWAHNSHVGDASATELAAEGKINLGQLTRERYAEASLLVGFSTFSGTVTAASDWGAPAERKVMPPALAGSHEDLFHRVGRSGLLVLTGDLVVSGAARGGNLRRLHRAVGVVYKQKTERASHYYESELHAQFDALVHLDQTRALEPLERWGGPELGEAPETFPSGL